MSKMHFERFDKLLKFLPKSKIQAGDGQKSGKYPFYTSSATLSKYIDTFNYEYESLIFGSGGNASIHYCNQKFATSTDCFVVNKDSDDIDIKYVYYYLKASIRILEDGFKGAGLKHISKKYISEIKIPFLPLQDQQKIAGLLSQIEELIDKREKSIKLLDELTKSTFLDMFGDPVLNPRKLKKEKIKNFGKIVTGNTPPRAEDKYYDNNFIEWVKTDNLFDDQLFATEAKEYLSEEGLRVGRKVKAGSLLVTCIAGSVKSIGTSCLVDRDVSFNQQINAIEPYEGIDSYFLYQLFKVSKLYVQNQAGKGMKKIITKSTFEDILFPMPDKDSQKKFGEIFQNVYNLRIIYQNSLTELNNLFGSIAQKAFKGELDVSKIELKADSVIFERNTIVNKKEDIKPVQVVEDNKFNFIEDVGKPLLVGAGVVAAGYLAAKTIEYVSDKRSDESKNHNDNKKNKKFKEDLDSEIIVENEVIYTDGNNNPVYNKDFVKMLINQAGQLTNKKLIDVIKQYNFKDKVSFDDIKKTIIELLENQEIEQISVVDNYEEMIGFKVKK